MSTACGFVIWVLFFRIFICIYVVSIFKPRDLCIYLIGVFIFLASFQSLFGAITLDCCLFRVVFKFDILSIKIFKFIHFINFSLN